MKPTSKKPLSRSAAVAVLAALVGTASACSNAPGSNSSSSSMGSTASASAGSSAPTGAVASANGANILLDSADKARVTKNTTALKDVISSCDAASRYQAKPVATLAPGRHYSSTGTNAPDPSSKTLEADSQQAYRFALCYLVTGNATYAGAAQKIIDAWATTLKTTPTISGKDNLAFFMTPMTPAAAWVRGVNGWNGAKYASFLKNVGLPNTKTVMAHKSNHGLWGVWYQSSAASYLGDATLLGATQQRWQALMKEEVAADGTMTTEIQRSGTSDYSGGADKGKKGLAYTNYALLPATLAAKTFADQGKPVWNSPGGALLGKAYAKAAGWIINPKSFPYYVSNHGELEGVTSAGYAAILQQHYPNAAGTQLLSKKMITGDAYLLTQLFPAS